jgi:HD-like signal output (HDOD) protein
MVEDTITLRNYGNLELIMANKKFQSTVGSAVQFQWSFYIKVMCAVRVHQTSANGH